MTAATSMSAPDGKSPPSHLWRVFWLQGVIPSNLLWAAALWALAQGMTELLLGLFVIASVSALIGYVLTSFIWRNMVARKRRHRLANGIAPAEMGDESSGLTPAE